jgi:hypothetical protein
MKRFTDVFEDFLNANPPLRAPSHLGGKAPSVALEQMTFFIEQLKSASRQNSRIVAVLVVLYIAMLVFGFIIVFKLLHEPKMLRRVLGGSFLSLLLILKGLQSVWREQNEIAIMISLLPSLSPAEAFKVAEARFYKAKTARSSRS